MSALDDKAILQYYYQTDTYAYGISNEGDETIALVDEKSGVLIDVMNGAGTIELCDSDGTAVLSADSIDRIEEIDGKALKIYYNLTGTDAENAELVTEYTFRENGIGVSQSVVCSMPITASANKSKLKRNFLRYYDSVDKDMVGKWYYPENGDYPYLVNESIATAVNIDKSHTVYTFVTSVKEDATIWRDTYPDINIPLNFTDGEIDGYTCTYELVLTSNTAGQTENRYRSLFKGRGSDYAVGIFPATENSENSTVFVGDSVDLKLNVANLTGEKFNFGLKYDVYDYYGEMVASGTVNAIPEGSANTDIRISGKYGMYYINIYAKSNNYTYRECYPLALIPTDSYENRQTNPFGLTSIEGHNVPDEYMTAAEVLIKTGAGNYRMSNHSAGQYTAVKRMVEAGVGINVQFGSRNIGDDYLKNIESFKKSLAASIDKVKDFADSIEVGNEIDGLLDTQKLSTNYVNGTLLPAASVVHNKGFKYANAGSAGSRTNFFDVLGESGLWNKLDILSSHSYGVPIMPDAISGGSDLWNYEQGCQRVAAALEKYGDKEWYMSETGYCTVPKDPEQVSLRTQADYNMRILVLGHSYGASRIQLYSFYDRASHGMGYNNKSMEMGYGICYQPDFLGVVKPKPTTAAFAVINYITDGLEKTEECQKYTTSTLRTFKLTKNDGSQMYVAWSNANPLPNAMRYTTKDRIVGMPWQNQWTDSETVTFETAESKVTVTDIMGNSKVYNPVDGKVEIPVTGSLVYIEGIK